MMGQSIICHAEVGTILDTVMKDISARVAGLTVQNVSEKEIGTKISSEPYSLIIDTRGDYDMRIILSADAHVMQTITKNMKRGREVAEEDIPIYSGEFFNILCGHIVSTVNTQNKKKASFGIPKFIKGSYPETDIGNSQHYFYKCQEGAMELETIL